MWTETSVLMSAQNRRDLEIRKHKTKQKTEIEEGEGVEGNQRTLFLGFGLDRKKNKILDRN